jgi:hypothetical protein
MSSGLVYRVKQARATYKFVTNTKVADVKIVEILKAFRGNIRKGNISRKKFEVWLFYFSTFPKVVSYVTHYSRKLLKSLNLKNFL